MQHQIKGVVISKAPKHRRMNRSIVPRRILSKNYEVVTANIYWVSEGLDAIDSLRSIVMMNIDQYIVAVTIS